MRIVVAEDLTLLRDGLIRMLEPYGFDVGRGRRQRARSAAPGRGRRHRAGLSGSPRPGAVRVDLLSIGVFGMVSGLSINALRHYDERGLLPSRPAPPS